MHLLVTGASGFIGRNMLLMLPRTWEIVALYRPSNTAFLDFLQQHQLEHVRPLACDLTDRFQVEQAMSGVRRDFECCLALASNTSIPGSIADPIQDLMTNSVGLLHILEHCTIEHLVYLSSGAVYVGLRGLVSPASVLSPDLPYAISKLAAEQYIVSFVRYRTVPKSATIIRFFGAYGPYEPARKLYTKLVHQFAFERNPHFTVIGDGENYIDAMYVDDAVRALMAVLKGPTPEGIHRFDLGMGNCESVNQVVVRAARAFGLEPQIHHEGISAEYIQFVIDPQSFSLAYQFTPEIALEVGLKQLAIHLAQKESKTYVGG